MKPFDTIYRGAQKIIERAIRQESQAQGHTLTGTMEASLTAEHTTIMGEEILEGQAVNYTSLVNDGFPASSASMKQFPFVVKYFELRGLQEEEAKRAAAATIRVWMKEGMSTKASARFSKTGKRQQMIENAFENANDELKSYMNASLDKAVNVLFKREKSETL